MEISKRKEALSIFLDKTLCGFFEHQIILNDDSEEEHTDFEVEIYNDKINQNLFTVCRVYDNKAIDVLQGEDFQYCENPVGFLNHLLINAYLTLAEL